MSPIPAFIASFRHRIEVSTLLAILVSVASIWVFVSVAGEVIEGDTRGLDRRILLTLRSASDPADPIGGPQIEEFGRDITALGGTGILILVTLFTAGLLWMQGNRRSMWLVLAAVGSGFVAYRLLKLGFDRPRPDLVPHGSYVYTASFPSGHTFMATVTYLTLAILVARIQLYRKVRIYLVASAAVLAGMVGVSRVYLGVHWPTDVLAGWTSGSAWALMWWLLARWLARRGAAAADTPAVEAPEQTHH